MRFVNEIRGNEIEKLVTCSNLNKSGIMELHEFSLVRYFYSWFIVLSSCGHLDYKTKLNMQECNPHFERGLTADLHCQARSIQ